VDSDGNRVNVGNFDSDGLNVNNNRDDNRNDNIGAASARKSPLCLWNARLSAGILLSSSRGFDPPAQLATDLVHEAFERDVLFAVDRFHIFHKPDQHSQKIEL
jgi:hypothetical protein